MIKKLIILGLPILLAACATNPPLPAKASADVTASTSEAADAPVNDYQGEMDR
jgi:hypothetical protein